MNNGESVDQTMEGFEGKPAPVFEYETNLEWMISQRPAWRLGLTYGKPRPGHPEGMVVYHIAEVLGNVDKFYRDHPNRAKLRLITMIHDNFKYLVDRSLPKDGENHHGMLARRWAERLLTDPEVLDVIETHDEAFNAWCKGNRTGKWEEVEERALRLIKRMGDSIDLYVAFFKCDNYTGDKTIDPFVWFEGIVKKAS